MYNCIFSGESINRSSFTVSLAFACGENLTNKALTRNCCSSLALSVSSSFQLAGSTRPSFLMASSCRVKIPCCDRNSLSGKNCIVLKGFEDSREAFRRSHPLMRFDRAYLTEKLMSGELHCMRNRRRAFPPTVVGRMFYLAAATSYRSDPYSGQQL